MATSDEVKKNRQTYTEGQEQDLKGDLYFDEKTLGKVYESLKVAGLPDQVAVDAVAEMQKRGVLFRERGKF